MKTFKLTTTFGPVLLLLLSLTSCKKDTNENLPVSATISAEDLLAYNIVTVVTDNANDKQQLKVFYFSKTGNDVTATLDAITSRRLQVIKLVNNSFTFDTNGDGKIVYTFTFEKDATGKLKTAAIKYVNLTTPSYNKIDGVAQKLSDVYSVKNRTFVSSGGGTTFSFKENTWTTTLFPNVNGSFYDLTAGAWKGNINGSDYMGVTVTQSSSFTMYLQKGDSLVEVLPR